MEEKKAKLSIDKKEDSCVVKPMSPKMVELIEDIKSQFLVKFGFAPSFANVTELISERIRKVGGVKI